MNGRHTGFNHSVVLTGSRYRSSYHDSGRLLEVDPGLLELATSPTGPAFVDSITWDTSNRVASRNGHKLTLKVAANGLFNGTRAGPGTTQSIPFRGALHQAGNYASGFATGTSPLPDTTIARVAICIRGPGITPCSTACLSPTSA